MVAPDDALPGRDEAMPVPAPARRARHPARAAVPRGARAGDRSAWAASGARSAVLAGARALHDRGRLRRRLHAEPDLRGGLLAAAPVTPRRCSSSSTRSETSTRRCCALFWENHDPTQGMRQGNDVGTQYRSAIYTTDERSARRPRRRATMFQAELEAAGYGEITTEIADAGPFFYAEDYHQQYLAKNPNGYCGLGGTGVVVPGRRSRRLGFPSRFKISASPPICGDRYTAGAPNEERFLHDIGGRLHAPPRGTPPRRCALRRSASHACFVYLLERDQKGSSCGQRPSPLRAPGSARSSSSV